MTTFVLVHGAWGGAHTWRTARQRSSPTRPVQLGRLLIALAVAVTLGPAVPAGSVVACSCEPTTVAEYDAYTVVALTGTQTSKETVGGLEGAEFGGIDAELTFEVDRVLKGVATETFRVRTGSEGDSCGIDLADQGLVGVMVNEHRDELVVNGCGSIRSVDELEAFYGSGTDPLPNPASVSPDGGGLGWPAGLAMAGVLVVFLLAGATLSRQRRA